MPKHQTQLSLLQDDIRSRHDSLSKRLKQVAQYIFWITVIALLLTR